MSRIDKSTEIERFGSPMRGMAVLRYLQSYWANENEIADSGKCMLRIYQQPLSCMNG